MWQYVAVIVTRATFGDWVILVSGLLLILYLLGTWNYDYFEKRGVASTKPKLPFLGDNLPFLLGKLSIAEYIKRQYKMSEGHAVFGMFEFTKPILIVREPELVKLVAIKEFGSFMNHRTLELHDPIANKNLLNLKDQPWREMRATLSPAFTTSKIKGIFPLISECGSQMVEYLRQKYRDSKEGTMKDPLPLDMKDLFTRLTNDVIATAAFGVSCDSLKQPENEFYHMGKSLTKLRALIFSGFLIAPKLMEALGFRMLDPKSIDFFDSLVRETIQKRQKNGIFRPDMVQLLMQAREGQLKTDAEDISEAEEVGAKTTKLTDDDITAQAILFFFAGFETVSTALCFTAHLLAHHQDQQKRLQDEIEEIMKKTGGEPTYEVIQAMKYLDAVVNESLRMYPPAGATDRVCGEDAQLPATAASRPVTVRKGQVVTVPIYGLHYDPNFFPDPDTFDPERFSDENRHSIKPFTYMPFGLGPRICIGQRLALIEVKLALVHLFANFDLVPSAKTKHPIEFAPGFNVQPKGGFWCELKPRDA